LGNSFDFCRSSEREGVGQRTWQRILLFFKWCCSFIWRSSFGFIKMTDKLGEHFEF
jgi:hypothetical protein